MEEWRKEINEDEISSINEPVPVSDGCDEYCFDTVSDDDDDDDDDMEDHCSSINICEELAGIIKRRRNTAFSKMVEDVFGHTKSDIYEYPMSIMTLSVFYHEVFGVTARASLFSVNSHNSVKYSDSEVVRMGDSIKIDKTIVNLDKNARKNKEDLYVGLINNDAVIVVMKGVVATVSKYGVAVCDDSVSRKQMEMLFRSIEYKKNDRKVKFAYYVVYNDGRFDTMSLKVKNRECDIGLNYNDDIPDANILNYINSDHSGLLILHGEPGTGKTSYIRNLIYKSNKQFLFFDKSIFHHMAEAALIQMLLEHRNSVIVLEDCEDLLSDRKGIGSCLGVILNLTDGILGDSMNFKFICTFNADIVDIDPAIKRKGRMHLKYEFKKLCGKKAKALGKKLGVDVPEKDMPLCDVYNYLSDNGAEKKEKKVGF